MKDNKLDNNFANEIQIENKFKLMAIWCRLQNETNNELYKTFACRLHKQASYRAIKTPLRYGW